MKDTLECEQPHMYTDNQAKDSRIFFRILFFLFLHKYAFFIIINDCFCFRSFVLSRELLDHDAMSRLSAGI